METRTVTTFADAVTVLTDPRYSLTPPGGDHPDNDTLFRDGPVHTRLRGLVARAFTPRRIAQLRPFVDAHADALVTAVLDAGPQADLVADLAEPLSGAVIAELLGVPDAERADLRRWAGAALLPGDQEAVAKAYAELYAHAAALVTRAPGGSLVADLAAVRDADDDRLDESELVAMIVTIVGAGYVSASSAIAVGAMQLIGGGLLGGEVTGDVVEEVLRRQAGRTGGPLPRWTTEDTELAPAGAMVRVRLTDAHRDPARYPDPDAFVPGRPAHIAFGRGPHHCLGAALARLELTAAFTALGRIPGLHLAVPEDEVEWFHGFVDSGPVAVPVDWP
jgi:cytochrome P450